MLLVTDTLFIGNFPMVHQGDTFRTTLKKVFKGKGIFFCGYKAEGLNFVEKKN